MIQPQEIRIANYIEYNGEIIKLDGSFLCCYIQNELDYPFNEVPLTEEWLLKLGFNKEGSDFTKEFRVHADCYSQLIITIDQKKAMIYMSTPDGDCNNAYLSFPHSVHQLQNLFYALTCEELTFKNPLIFVKK